MQAEGQGREIQDQGWAAAEAGLDGGDIQGIGPT